MQRVHVHRQPTTQMRRQGMVRPPHRALPADFSQKKKTKSQKHFFPASIASNRSSSIARSAPSRKGTATCASASKIWAPSVRTTNVNKLI